ncbi:hypothetical protein BXZ70DRAFT_1013407 [Cristinia sonorae]|uniref:Uncharacterized protein n=1 Tax=Cristinia sonorae TaxID=1940300 RepID=A0A8K0UD21_9AGAR|nr:hypothetical protein BXZ70DRAFT_1013407 [Cristinia sonorae]
MRGKRPQPSRFRPAARTWTPTPPHRTAATPSKSRTRIKTGRGKRPQRGRFRPAARTWTPTPPHRTAATPSKSRTRVQDRVRANDLNEVVSDPPGTWTPTRPQGRRDPSKSPHSRPRPSAGQTTSTEVVSDPPRGPGRQHDPTGQAATAPKPRTRVQDRARGKRPQPRSFPTRRADLDANTTPLDGRDPSMSPHSPPCPCGGSETTSFEVVSPALGLGCSHPCTIHPPNPRTACVVYPHIFRGLGGKP